MEKKTVWFVEVEWLVSKHFAVSAPADMDEDQLEDLLRFREDTLNHITVLTPLPMPLDPEKSITVLRLLHEGNEGCSSISVEEHGPHHG